MSSLASFVVVFLSRTFETHVVAQEMPTGYEIREQQSFSHLSIRRRGSQTARDLVPDSFQNRLGPLSAT